MFERAHKYFVTGDRSLRRKVRGRTILVRWLATAPEPVKILHRQRETNGVCCHAK